MPFHRLFDTSIPFEKAASFYVGLKSWQPLPAEDEKLLAQCIKTAAEEGNAQQAQGEVRATWALLPQWTGMPRLSPT